MNGDFTFTLDRNDYNRLERALSQLESVDKGVVIQKSMKEGGKIMIDRGKLNLKTRNKKRTGKLSRSFAAIINKKKQEAKIGFRKGGNAAHLIDRGTNERWTKAGKYTGSVSSERPNTGSQFWSEAVEDTGDKALNRIIDAVYENIEKIMDRNS